MVLDDHERPERRPMLPRIVLSHASTWMKAGCMHRLRCASRGHHAGMLPPDVPAALLEQMRSHLPIRREVAFFELERLAKRGAGEAIKAVVACLGDTLQEQELRKWALQAIQDIAEPGDEWAISAITRPGGPLLGANSNVAEKAIEVLSSVADAGNAHAITALATLLGDGRFSCRAGLTIAKIAEGVSDIDKSAVKAVQAQLSAASHRVQANALTALGFVARNSDNAMVRELLVEKAANSDLQIRYRAVSALAQVRGQRRATLASHKR